MPDGPASKAPEAGWPSGDRRITVLLLLAVSGCVDGIGLAETGHVFASAMSGNTTSAGLALAGHDWRHGLVLLGAVALFVAGAGIGTLVDDRVQRRAPLLLLLVEAGIVLLAWIAYRGPWPLVGTLLLPLAMGLANLVVTRLANARPGATYVTGTLVRIGIDVARADGRSLASDLSLWVPLLVGALAGGWGRAGYGTDVLLAPVAVLIALAIAAAKQSR